MSYSSEPSVLILMGTFNGEKYIREQLDSIVTQSHENWRLVISDDGSTDQTLEIVREWASEVGQERVEFRIGPQSGFAQNFLSMACDPNLNADFYAFSDQDDVWRENKLKVALEWARKNNQEIPLLYCGRTEYFKDDRRIYARSPLFKKPPSFKNALVQSIAGGNTMLFNAATKQVLQSIGITSPASHDWWLYQVVTGINGMVFYDPNPQLLYRQHSLALIGGNNTVLAKLKRMHAAARGRFKEYSDQNIACLLKAYEKLHPDNKNLLNQFCRIRRLTTIKRVVELRRTGLYRQTTADNFNLTLLAAAGKI